MYWDLKSVQIEFQSIWFFIYVLKAPLILFSFLLDYFHCYKCAIISYKRK